MEVLFPNALAEKRTAAGLTADELAQGAGLDPAFYERIERGEVMPSGAEFIRIVTVLGIEDVKGLYTFAALHGMGFSRGLPKPGAERPKFVPAEFYEPMADTGRLLVSRNEQIWFDHYKAPEGDEKPDAFVNMSCGTQQVPHLIFDAAAILEDLGVRFAAASGRQFCCGSNFRANGLEQAAERMHEASLKRALSWGAPTVVHLCTKCQMTFSGFEQRAEAVGKPEPPVRHVQLLGYIAEQLESCEIRWRREVPARVLVHHHSNYAPTLKTAAEDAMRLLRKVPGVEVVGLLDRSVLDSFCDPSWSGGRPEPRTPADVHEIRTEIADYARSLGADTISCQHQRCHQTASYYSSERLTIRHSLSIVAEALTGQSYPDRYQTAIKLGDPEAVVAQTRAAWSSWGMTEEKALKIAREVFDPMFGSRAVQCAGGCGPGGACSIEPDVIAVDVLGGSLTKEAVGAH